MELTNPFIYAGANELDDEAILNFYISSHEYETILSKKNIFIIGQRGSGKSMLLKYNALSLKLMQNNNQVPDVLGIYVPCNRPYFKKLEHMLLAEGSYEQSIIAEHFLVLSLAKQLINAMIKHSEVLFTDDDLQDITDELNFLFDLDSSSKNCLNKMRQFLSKEFRNMQETLLSEPSKLKISALSFGTLVFPIIEMMHNCKAMQNKHITFLIDDAHQLNEIQMKTLNTWISYRDTSLISFKVAIAGKEEYIFYTETESSIMENHDYLEISLQGSMFGSKSDFNIFAKEVIQKRLELKGFKTTDPNQFFAIDKSIVKELNQCKDRYRKGQCPESQHQSVEKRRKSININRYHRAIYFREILSRHKANKPKLIYTGFSTITGLSTGIIRNLLIMCHEMYLRDYEYFRQKSKSIPPHIRTTTQHEAILDLSRKKWMDLQNIDRKITDCSREDAEKLYLFFENFGNLLLDKILEPSSTEKKILSFSISNSRSMKTKIKEFERLFNIAKQDGYIYTRLGRDKSGGRTIWYTPNRLLWPNLGLDPLGENGHFSLGGSTVQSMFERKISPKSFQDGGLFNVL